MNVTVYKERITGILQKAGNITPARAAMAALRAIWLKAEGTTLACISTDASVDYAGSCIATVTSPGIVGVDGKNLVDLVSKLPSGEIRLRVDGESGNLLVEQGRRKYKMPFVDAQWFVPPRPFPEQSTFLAGDVIHEIIDRVRFCISTEAGADAIGCLMLRKHGEGVEAVGLNGFIMASYRIENADFSAMLSDCGMLVAEKHLQFIKKTLPTDEVEMGTCGSFLYFRHGNGTEHFSLPLSTYQAPDLDAVFARATDGNVPILQLQRGELEEALARTAIFNTTEDRTVKLWLEAGHVTIAPSACASGEASEIIDATYSGGSGCIAFPTLKMREMLGHFTSARVNMRMQNPERPCCITGDDDPRYMAIIMPMKVAETPHYEGSESV